MSRVTKISGAALLTLVSLGVLAALAQTAQKPPTELYVRTVPSGAAILVDGKQRGTSPELFEVEPGQHTVVARLEGYQPETKKVTVRDGRIKRVILGLQKRPEARVAPKAVASGQPKLSPRKLFSVRQGADAGILAVAFSPDGLTVAAVDEQGKITLHDARSGGLRWSRGVLTPEEKKLLLYEDRQGRIHTASIGYSPDGYTLAVAADAVVRLYDAQSGRLLRALEDKQLVEALKALKRPPATVSRELELLKAVPHAHGRVYSVAFSPDGKLLATSGSHLIRADGSSVIHAENATPGKLKLWDAKTGELKRDLGEHFGAVRSVAFSHDAKTLASIGSHPPSWTSSVRLWDPQTATVKKVLRILPHGGLGEESVALSPDGKLVAAGAVVTGLKEDGPDGGIQRLGAGRRCRLLVFNAGTGDLLFSPRMPGQVTSLSFSADGKTLAAGVDGRGVTLWDSETLTQKVLIQLSTDPPREVQVAFSPTGNLLAVGAKNKKQGLLTVWEIDQPGDQAAAAAKRFLAALVARDVAKMQGLIVETPPRWTADGMPGLVKEIRDEVYVNVPHLLTEIRKTLVQDDWAAVRIDGPSGPKGKYLWLVLRRGPDGWRACYMDDSDPKSTLEKWFKEFISRHGDEQPSKPEQGGDPAPRPEQEGDPAEEGVSADESDQPGDHAAAAAKRFLAALVARDVAQMQSLIVETPPWWTAEKMPGLMKELRDEVYVDIPHRLTEIRETLVRDDWAAVRIYDPKGSQGSYMWLVLRRGPGGWRVFYMDDSGPKITLESRLKEFISKHGDEQPPRPEQQPADDGLPAEEDGPAEESVSAEESGPVAEVLGRFSPRKWYSASHGADAGVLAVAFSPDGKTLAAVDEAAKVILYNARKPRQTTSYTDTGGLGRRIMSLDLLTPEEKKLLLNKDRPQQIHSGAVAFSPDGKTLAVGGGPVVKLFDSQTGRLQLALEDKQLIEEIKKLGGNSEQLDKLAAAPHAHGSVESVAFSPDGTLLATSGRHIIEASGATPGHIKLWDAKTGELKRDLGEHFGAVRSVAFSPDGKIMASAGNHPPRWTASVRSWDPQTGAIKSMFFIPRGDPWSVAFSPDGKLMAAGGIIHEEEDDPTSGTLLVWNARTGARLISRPLPGVVASIAFSADGKTLATGEYERGVTLWDPETLKPKGEIKPQTDLPRDLTGTVCVAFSPSGNLLAIGAENERHGFVTIWEIGEPEKQGVTRLLQ